MTTRTVQVFGQSTLNGNPTTGNITATLNGITVFSGTVPTAADPGMLFTFPVDMTLDGSIPMVVTIQDSNVYMGSMLVNYDNQGPVEPQTTPPTYISSGPDGFFDPDPVQDSRANVNCTGAQYCSPPPPDPRPEGTAGTWGWQVDIIPGQPAVFSYDFQIVAGVE